MCSPQTHFASCGLSSISLDKESSKRSSLISAVLHITFSAIAILSFGIPVTAQDTVTGAFEGIVTDSQNGSPLKGVFVVITNQQTGATFNLRTNYRGRFFQGLLLPGIYTVRVSMPGYQTKETAQLLRITYTGEVVPVPVALDAIGAAATTTPPPSSATSAEDNDIRATIPTIDGRRSGSFTEKNVVTLPMGGTTLTRTFDEFALLLSGVAPPPETFGNVAGPGVGQESVRQDNLQ